MIISLSNNSRNDHEMTIIHEMIQLEYSVDFTSYSACKSVFKDIGSTQTSIFSPNTGSYILCTKEQSRRYVYFLQFSLISVQPLHFYIGL